ncbi:uncharacterized protein [Venturia canescens]|uniref:uncharacterized protein n=1 Tax=Venturia canescens TaxID=32260 RepID=UPI001C9D409E|nr:uncharacterized protein LOC122417770 [Venturia canescens]
MYDVLTNKKHDEHPYKYDVNCKLVIALVDAGIGEAQINTILSALNIKSVSMCTIRKYEMFVAKAFTGAAKISCQKAIAMEISNTKAEQPSETSNDLYNENMNPGSCVVGPTVKGTQLLLGLSPGKNTKAFREHKDKLKEKRRQVTKTLDFYKRRCEKETLRKKRDSAASRKEGTSYESGCGLNNASEVLNDLPPTADENQNYMGAKFVFVDLETSGLGPAAEICQNGINARASEITGLSVVNGELFLDDEKQTTVSLQTALSNFLRYLSGFQRQGPIILLAHNGTRFDFPIILRNMEKLNLMSEYRAVVAGFVDTLDVFKKVLPKRESYSQENLATALLNPDGHYHNRAHNAISDVLTLNQLVNTLNDKATILLQATKSFGKILRDQKMKPIATANVATLQPLVGAISRGMITKIAKAGIAMSALTKIFNDSGEAGVRSLLTEMVNGVVRVTNNKAILAKLISKLSELQSHS